jgi:hypothetical protein
MTAGLSALVAWRDESEPELEIWLTGEPMILLVYDIRYTIHTIYCVLYHRST